MQQSENPPDTLNAAQHANIQRLMKLLPQRGQSLDALALSHALEHAVLYRQELRTTWANAARVSCGGTLPNVEAQDPVQHALERLAVDYFPLALIRPPRDLPTSFLHLADLHRHPATAAFQKALLQDVALQHLVPPPSRESPIQQRDLNSATIASHLIWSSGHGGGLVPLMLTFSLLEYVFICMRLRGSAQSQHITHFVGETVALARSLAVGTASQVILVAALANITLNSGVAPELPGGSIIPPDRVRNLLPIVDERATTVLYLSVDLQLLDVIGGGRVNDEDEINRKWAQHTDRMDATLQAVRQAIDRAQLAIVMASDSSAVLAPALLGQMVLNRLFVSDRGGAVGVTSVCNA